MSERLNPYTALGVEATATPEEIKQAFRAIARKHHPDVAGGENRTFNDARVALDILSDPGSRRRYDDFGVLPDDADSAVRMKAIEELSQLFVTILSQVTPDNLLAVDFLGSMRAAAVARQRKIDDKLRALPADETRLASYQKVLAARMRRNAGGKDIFSAVMDALVSQTAAMRAELETESMVAKAMLDELGNYSFDVEGGLQRQGPSRTGTWVSFSLANL